MNQSHGRPVLARWGVALGLILLALGLFGFYLRLSARSSPTLSTASVGLICRVQQPAPSPDAKPASPAQIAAPSPSLFTGALLKLSGASKASLDETVVVSLCVQPAPGLPEQRQQALKNHLLVQLSAAGLQLEPREKVPAQQAAPGCMGTAEWTLRASAPGRYSIVLSAESTDDQPHQLAASPPKPRWDFDLERSARLDIQFQDAWTTVIQKTWSPISAVLGIVLVITQIRLNSQQRKTLRSS
jgi:hypothetical protein